MCVDGVYFHYLNQQFTFLLLIFLWIITEPFRAPSSVRLTSVNNQPRELTFTWDTVESSCPSLQYRVNATGCGTCTSTSTSNTTTCVDYDVTVDQLCTFAVHTVICDDIVSVMNASIQVPLKGNSVRILFLHVRLLFMLFMQYQTSLLSRLCHLMLLKMDP